MAALTGATQLTTISPQNQGFLYIEHGPGAHGLLATTSKRHVTVYDLISQKSLLNWSAKSGLTLTRGVVHNDATKKYAAIINKQICRLWTAEDKDISKSQKVTLPRPGHSLVDVGGGVAVVYEDGTLSQLSDVRHTIGKPVTDKIRWVGIRKVDNSVHVAVVTRSIIQLYTATGEDISCRIINVAVGDVVSMCLHHSDGQLFLITIALNGQLSQIALSGSAVGEVTNMQKVDGLTKHVGLTSLGSMYIAIAGIRKDGEEGVCIWDMKFGIPVWTGLPEATRHSTCQFQCLARGNHLVVLCSKSIYVLNFTIKPPSLADALGKFKSASLRQVAGKDDERVKLFSHLCDPLKTKTKKQFAVTFTKLMDSLKELGEKTLLYQSELTSLVKRCLTEERFWCGEQIHKLIKANMVPTCTFNELFEVITKREELAILHSGLCHLHNIPEAALLASLTCCLRVDENKFSSITDEEMLEQDEDAESDQTTVCPFNTQKAAFINQILLLPFNDIFMVECLRKFEFSLSLKLLKYLHYLLMVAPKSNTDATTHPLPSLLKVVDWVSVVLDAHFTQLILTSDAQQTLVELHELVESQVHFFDGLISLETVLYQLKEKCQLPQKHNPGHYNIHTLHIY